MARVGGGWLREGKPASATHAIEKTPQFRAAMARFAEGAGERLGATFGALFTAAAEPSHNGHVFAALTEHAGQPATALYSATFDARMAMMFEASLVGLMVSAMFGFEAANDSATAQPPPPTELEMRLIGEVAARSPRRCATLSRRWRISSSLSERPSSWRTIRCSGPKDAQALLAPIDDQGAGGRLRRRPGAAASVPHRADGGVRARAGAGRGQARSRLVEPHGAARHRSEPDADRDPG